MSATTTPATPAAPVPIAAPVVQKPAPAAPAAAPAPAVRELFLTAPSADDLAILDHVKEWVRREIALAAAGRTLDQRKTENA